MWPSLPLLTDVHSCNPLSLQIVNLERSKQKVCRWIYALQRNVHKFLRRKMGYEGEGEGVVNMILHQAPPTTATGGGKGVFEPPKGIDLTSLSPET